MLLFLSNQAFGRGHRSSALAVALASIASVAFLTACGSEKRKSDTVAQTPAEEDKAKETPAAAPVVPAGAPVPEAANAEGTKKTGQTESTKPAPESKAVNPSLNTLVTLLSSGGNAQGATSNLVGQILGGADPKLVAAIVTCPGVLNASLDVNSLVSKLLAGAAPTGSTATTTTATTAASTSQQNTGAAQVTALAACLAKTLL